MDKKNKIEQLLSHITSIRHKYEKQAELTGENFNVFNILRLSHYEVRTHSAFIGELLNPSGTHGQKEKYLKLFTDVYFSDFDSNNAKIELEKHIGYISEDRERGGNIDILISDNKKRAIIIENKINASDQEKQLLRYYNYGKDNGLEFKLFYLTLNGSSPEEYSRYSLDKNNYINISYEKNILAWIKNCLSESQNLPGIKETLKQYIYLIKQLTNQTTDIMKKEIIELIISNEELLDTYLEISKFDIVANVRKTIFIKIKKDLENLAKELGLGFKCDENIFAKETCFYYILPNSKYHIEFGFDGYFNKFYRGIFSADYKESYPEEHKKLITERLGNNIYPTWLWAKDFDYPLDNWNNKVVWIMMLNGTFTPIIKEELLKMYNNLKGIAYL